MNKLWFLFPFLFYVVCVDDGQKTYGGCKKENHESDKVMLTRKMIFGK